MGIQYQQIPYEDGINVSVVSTVIYK
jgi:hypothetical protein